jgi:hypothetical protein
MSPIDNTLKSRRQRLSPYTAAERRLNKSVRVVDEPIATRHSERGLMRKSFARKAQRS